MKRASLQCSILHASFSILCALAMLVSAVSPAFAADPYHTQTALAAQKVSNFEDSIKLIAEQPLVFVQK